MTRQGEEPLEQPARGVRLVAQTTNHEVADFRIFRDGTTTQRGSRPAGTYIQVAGELAGLIQSGQLAPGTQFPPERELSQQLGMSRTTVRQVLARLEDWNLITREVGRGTFVSRPKWEHSLSVLGGFHEQMAAQGVQPTSRLLSGTRGDADPATAQLLGIDVADPVFKIVRLRLAQGDPVALENSIIPVDVVPDLFDHDLTTESIYGVMGARGARPVRAAQRLEPVPARTEEAELLDVDPGTPLMLIRRTAWDAAGRVVEHAVDYYRGDRTSFVSEVRIAGDFLEREAR
ncbi:GntR family transcriptional regulator [Phytohabitans kaempferiae]|uniref:GntR family transcriptional regulator n=1 Tax=Phytohabitans kaempferiae TaxID=1620943 RepID=A0ABV6MA22_9ACTN